MKLRYGLCAAALAAAVPMSALAADAGPYVGLGAGISFGQDLDVDGTIAGVPGSGKIDLEHGWGAIGAAGYKFGNGFRAELELGYRKNDVDTFLGLPGSGSVSAWSLMGNVLYDFDTGSKLKPYLGLGLGGLRGSVNNVGATAPGGALFIDDTDTVFALQGIAGLSYQVNNNLEVFADYRYLRAQDLRVNNALVDVAVTPPPTGGVVAAALAPVPASLDTEYTNHSIMVGLRYTFGKAPAPVAQAAPEPEPAAPEPAPVPKTYLVFFDWDRANLTGEAQDIVHQAAANALAGQQTRIVATGHADRSGSDKYNLGLSKRRAEAVQQELERQGVAAGDIKIDWKGERDPLVPTPDGVREPQNRRVEIVFQ